ncbi:PfkB family carbohydrate kinase [Collibacillus ludicampi]|jgi:fructokinase|nr:PfkB family carbohydrate kinase [Collibacillus ludicampi]
MKRIISLGEALIDFVSIQSGCGLEESPGFEKTPGGAPANVAAAVAKLGGEAGFIGKTGDDPFGYFLRDTLQSVGVDTSQLVHTVAAKTALAFVSLRENGERDFMFYRDPSADMLLEPNDIHEEYIRDSFIFHFGSISLITEPVRSATLKALHVAKKGDVVISFDPNWRPSLWGSPEQARKEIEHVLPFVDILKINEEEMVVFTGTTEVMKAAEYYHTRGIPMIIITLGKEGCYYSYLQDETKVSGFCKGLQVEVIDTTGAGDAFVGGLLNRLTELSNENFHEISIGKMRCLKSHLQEAVTFAVATSALAVTKKGAISALPDREQVESLLRKNGGEII